jgi:hypothetical protein
LKLGFASNLKEITSALHVVEEKTNADKRSICAARLGFTESTVDIEI